MRLESLTIVQRRRQLDEWKPSTISFVATVADVVLAYRNESNEYVESGFPVVTLRASGDFGKIVIHAVLPGGADYLAIKKNSPYRVTGDPRYPLHAVNRYMVIHMLNAKLSHVNLPRSDSARP